MNNMPAAAQLSLFALIVISGLLATELYARSRRSFQNLSNTKRGVPRIALPNGKKWRVYSVCLLPVLTGFVIPVAILLSFLGAGISADVKAQFWSLLGNNLQFWRSP